MFRLLTSLLTAFLFTLTAWAGINVNSASESELTGLPGIGPAKAAAIVQHRTQNGPFKNLGDLDAVSGIGPATLANITPLVTFSGDQASGTEAPAAKAASSAPAAPAPAGGSININAVDASGLQALPGIGPSKAEAIVSDRTTNGPFASCSDLQRVRGVGPATVAGIVTLCTTK
jgi:competence protein ComEA